MTRKEEIINAIKGLVEKHDMPSFSDMNVESSPVLFSLGNTIVLVESFSHDDVTAITYCNDEEVDENDVKYEDLDEDVLWDIREILDTYDAESEKTWERCQD